MTDNNNQFSETVDNVQQQGAEYDVFSENKKAVTADFGNRDYLKRIYGKEFSLPPGDILMTRSQYNEELAKIEKYYKKERLKCVMICVSGLLMTLILIFGDFALFKSTVAFVKYTGTLFAFVLLNMLCVTVLVPVVTLGSMIKRSKKISAAETEAVRSVEDIKEELMRNGKYDALN